MRLFSPGCAALLMALLWSCSDSSPLDKLIITGSTTVAPVVEDAAREFEKAHPNTRIDVQTGGSSRGIADTLSGAAGLGMVSRPLKPEETGLDAHRIAWDGIAMIVHRDNPVSNLTREQIIAIYRKQIANWKELGGTDATIRVTHKADGRGTQEVFLHYTALDSAEVRADVVVGENQQAIKAVAADPQAIGYVSIGAAASEAEAGTAIKLLAIGGVAATTENVANGSFSMVRPLQIVTRSGEITGLARDFLDYLKSPAVAPIVSRHLYVPAAER